MIKGISLFLLSFAFICVNAQDFTFLEYTKNFNINAVIQGDVNSDGKIDYITESDFGGNSYIGLASEEGIVFNVFSENLVIENLRVFDLDLDGDNDIIASAKTADKTVLFINDGDENFERVETDLPKYHGIEIADLDKDGVSELILTQNNEIRIIQLPNLSIGHTISESNNGFRPSFIRSIDFNQDGLLDFAVLNDKSDIFIYIQSDSQQYEKNVLIENLFVVSEFYLANLNQDSNYDIVTYGFDPKVLIGNDDGTYEDANVFNDEVSWLSVGNLDDDDMEEVLFVGGGFLSETISLAGFNDSSEMFEITELSSSYSNTRKGGIADLNNDGVQDFFLYSASPTGKLVEALRGDVQLVDNDNDGYTNDVDCDDENSEIYPGADEVCDGLDNNCNGQIDDGFTFLSWWIDQDEDGFGALPMEDAIVDCKQPDGYVQNYDDCDDTNPNINPEASEIPDNGIDEDCDGMDLTTGVHQLGDSKIRIFPNPAFNILNVSVEGLSLYQVSIFNLDGSKIFTELATPIIDVSALSQGMYLIEIKDLNTGDRIVDKVVVRK